MLYIVTALKSEAQAFVEKYKLTKSAYENFTVFSNGDLKVIVSGVGIENSKNATKALLKIFDAKSDVIVNVGICGADKKYEIGSLIKVGAIVYKNEKQVFDERCGCVLTCVDEEMSQDLHDIADMESFGFYEAAKELQNRHIYKVVSDHFEPGRVTKEGTKKLILGVIEQIMKEVAK